MAIVLNGTSPVFNANPAADLNQSVSNNTWTKITLDSEQFDTENKFASSKFTPTIAGYYIISYSVRFGLGSSPASGNQILAAVYKNGSDVFRSSGNFNATGTSMGPSGSGILYLDTDDYIELYGYQSSGVSVNVSDDIANGTHFTGALLYGT
tara:strand:+ start:116 stop:571 length:456 start_codon:yes stop_codon:yes gene_type:complete